MLSRAERASDHRGWEYLSERMGALRNRWTDSKTGSTRRRYRKRRRPVRRMSGLLGDLGPATPFKDRKPASSDDAVAAEMAEVLISAQHGQFDVVGQTGDLLDAIAIGYAGRASG